MYMNHTHPRTHKRHPIKWQEGRSYPEYKLNSLPWTCVASPNFPHLDELGLDLSCKVWSNLLNQIKSDRRTLETPQPRSHRLGWSWTLHGHWELHAASSLREAAECQRHHSPRAVAWPIDTTHRRTVAKPPTLPSILPRAIARASLQKSLLTNLARHHMAARCRGTGSTHCWRVT